MRHATRLGVTHTFYLSSKNRVPIAEAHSSWVTDKSLARGAGVFPLLGRVGAGRSLWCRCVRVSKFSFFQLCFAVWYSPRCPLVKLRPMVETDRGRALSVEEVPKRGGAPCREPNKFGGVGKKSRRGDTERVRMGRGGGDGGRRECAAWPRPGGLPPSSLAPSHNYPFPPPHQLTHTTLTASIHS